MVLSNPLKLKVGPVWSLRRVVEDDVENDLESPRDGRPSPCRGIRRPGQAGPAASCRPGAAQRKRLARNPNNWFCREAVLRIELENGK